MDAGSRFKELDHGNNFTALYLPQYKTTGIYIFILGVIWDLISGSMLFGFIYIKDNIDYIGVIITTVFFIIGFLTLLIGLAYISITTAIIYNNKKIKYEIKTFLKDFNFEIDNEPTIVIEKLLKYPQINSSVCGIKISNSENKKIKIYTIINEEEFEWIRNKIKCR
jgi:hypothetical protein